MVNELYHWGIRKGGQKKNHKYISREWKNGRWRYYYYNTKKRVNREIQGKDNMYDVDPSNYDEKMKLIKNSKEWQDIMKRNDPEYWTLDKNGNKVWLIDDYLVKKKHPELDVLDDFSSGRQITLNSINKDSLIAGGKDYTKSIIGKLGIKGKLLTESFKYQQGSYKNEEKEILNSINTGSSFINQLLKNFTGR